MAAPAFIQKSSGSASSTTLTTTAPTGSVAGDIQIVLLSVGTSSETVGTTPAGWTKLAELANTLEPADTFRTVAYYSTTAGTANAAFPKSGTRFSMWLRLTYRGGAGLDVASVQMLGRAASTTHAIPGLTTQGPDSVVVATIQVDSGNTLSTTFTMPAGWNERHDQTLNNGSNEYESIGSYDQAFTTAQSVAANITASRSDVSSVFSVELLGDPVSPHNLFLPF